MLEIQESTRVEVTLESLALINREAYQGATPLVTVHFVDHTKTPDISVIVPVYNQANIIRNNLVSILENISSPFHLIVILDACSDSSCSEVFKFATDSESISKHRGYGTLCGMTVITSRVPLFEATCDNLGFAISRDVLKVSFALEIQADMQLIQYGIDRQLRKPFLHYKDVLAVSGRLCAGLPRGTHPHEWKGVGKFGVDIDRPLRLKSLNEYSKFYVDETVCRGPILFDLNKLHEIGYLDDINFPLSDDDHDLCARAWAEKNWVVGYVPIEFKSPLIDGSTRKQRDQLNVKALARRREAGIGGYLRSIQMSKTPSRTATSRTI